MRKMQSTDTAARESQDGGKRSQRGPCCGLKRGVLGLPCPGDAGCEGEGFRSRHPDSADRCLPTERFPSCVLLAGSAPLLSGTVSSL